MGTVREGDVTTGAEGKRKRDRDWGWRLQAEECAFFPAASGGTRAADPVCVTFSVQVSSYLLHSRAALRQTSIAPSHSVHFLPGLPGCYCPRPSLHRPGPRFLTRWAHSGLAVSSHTHSLGDLLSGQCQHPQVLPGPLLRNAPSISVGSTSCPGFLGLSSGKA